MKSGWISDRGELFRRVRNKGIGYLDDRLIHWCDAVQVGEKLSCSVILALGFYGEVRGEKLDGKRAFVEVVVNRLQNKKYQTIEDVLLEPLQFSCFYPGDRSLVGCDNIPIDDVRKTCAMASAILDEIVVSGSRLLKSDTTIYLTEKAFQRVALDWALDKKHCWDITKLKRRGKIGNHLFFAE